MYILKGSTLSYNSGSSVECTMNAVSYIGQDKPSGIIKKLFAYHELDRTGIFFKPECFH